MPVLSFPRVLFCAMTLTIALSSGCSAPRRYLHSVTADEFTLFPAPPGQPPPLGCSGDIQERFVCFARKFRQREQELNVAAAFALVAPDGTIQTVAHTDDLNASVLTVDAETRFPAASVTKMFVAAAAISLSLDGSLDLQKPIAEYVPELSRELGVGRATLHQLLTHTSGLGNPEQCDSVHDDLKDLLRKYARAPLWAPPGALYNYSNIGYSFAAIVLERVTGKPFETVVYERVLVPAGIPSASFEADRIAVRGHLPNALAASPRCRAMSPSGGLVLSVRELAQWARALAQPDSANLGRPLLDLLTAPHVSTGGRAGEAYGYGVLRYEQGGVTILNHSGALPDFTAFVAWSPVHHLGVAAFVNGNPHGPSAVALGLRAISTFLNLSDDWQPPLGARHPLSAYAGVYIDEAGGLGRVRIRLDDGHLAVDYLDGPPPQLPPNFRFVFEPGSSNAHYVVTAVGVGKRSP